MALPKKKTVKIKRAKLIIKQFEGGCSNSWAIFRSNAIPASHTGIVSHEDGAVPFKGYSGMSKDYAECVLERLLKEI